MYRVIFILVFVLLFSFFSSSQDFRFSKSYDIDLSSDNGTNVLKMDTFLIVQSPSICDFPVYHSCGAILCTNLAGDELWKTSLDSLVFLGNEAIALYDGIVYSGVRRKDGEEFQLYMVSHALSGELLAIDSIHVGIEVPRLRGIRKIDNGWLLNIMEWEGDNFYKGSLVWVDEAYQFLDKKVYSDTMYRFWFDDWFFPDDGGILISGAYTTNEWPQEHSLIRLDDEGDVKWTWSLPPPYENGSSRVALADDGNILVSYRLDLFLETPLELGWNPRPYSLQKMTPAGDTLWRHLFWEDIRVLSEFFIADNGDIIGMGSYEFFSDTLHEDSFGYIYRMTQEGEMLWHKNISDRRFGRSLNFLGNGLELNSGDLVFSGAIRDTNYFFDYLSTAINIWLVRTDADGCLYDDCADVTYVTSTSEVSPQMSAFSLHPNITNEQSMILPASDINQQGWRMSVYNLSGQLVHAESIRFFPQAINVSNYPPGIYLVRLDNKLGQYQVMRLVVY